MVKKAGSSDPAQSHETLPAFRGSQKCIYWCGPLQNRILESSENRHQIYREIGRKLRETTKNDGFASLVTGFGRQKVSVGCTLFFPLLGYILFKTSECDLQAFVPMQSKKYRQLPTKITFLPCLSLFWVGIRLNSLFQKSSFRIAILISYWILGFVVTHIPLRHTGEVLIPNLDKVAHFILYGGLGFLMALWIGTGKSTLSAAMFAMIICVIYAFLDEGLQYFIPTRNASFLDWLADVLGAFFGVVLYILLRQAIKTKTRSET